VYEAVHSQLPNTAKGSQVIVATQCLQNCQGAYVDRETCTTKSYFVPAKPFLQFRSFKTNIDHLLWSLYFADHIPLHGVMGA
jgi:hypothetical protein